MDDGRSVGRDERQILTVGVQSEVRVKLVADSVLSGREDDEPLTGLEDAGRKAPARKVAGKVGEKPTAQIDRTRPRVLDLDPVARVAIFVAKPLAVVREEFGDERIRRSELGDVRHERRRQETYE